MLQAAGEQAGSPSNRCTPSTTKANASSSSAVRALAEGDMPHAARLLGRPSISGRVMHGDKIGRTIGFPTANIQPAPQPAADGHLHRQRGRPDRPSVAGVASVGVRPTINDAGRPSLEVHLFDWNTDATTPTCGVNFLRKQRDEERYDSLDALTAQIARDADEARAYFAQNPASSEFPGRPTMSQKVPATTSTCPTLLPDAGDLAKREPGWIADWQQASSTRRSARQGRRPPKFILHDGPPYANGSIHIGHASTRSSGHHRPFQNPGRLRRPLRAGLGLPRPAHRTQDRSHPRQAGLPADKVRELCRAYAV